MPDIASLLDELRKAGTFIVWLPVTDALSFFVAKGERLTQEMRVLLRLHGPPHMEPEKGGTTYTLPLRSGEAPKGRFKVVRGGWTESCRVCGANIKSGTECGGFNGTGLRLICLPCHAKVQAGKAGTRASARC